MGLLTAIEHAVKEPVCGCRMCGKCSDLDIPLRKERTTHAHGTQLAV